MGFDNVKNKIEYLWLLSDKNTALYNEFKKYPNLFLSSISYIKKTTTYTISEGYDFRINNKFYALVKLEGINERMIPFIKPIVKILPETAVIETVTAFNVGISFLTIGIVYFAFIYVHGQNSKADILLHIRNPQIIQEVKSFKV